MFDGSKPCQKYPDEKVIKYIILLISAKIIMHPPPAFETLHQSSHLFYTDQPKRNITVCIYCITGQHDVCKETIQANTRRWSNAVLMLGQHGPTLKRHWGSVSCWLGKLSLVSPVYMWAARDQCLLHWRMSSVVTPIWSDRTQLPVRSMRTRPHRVNHTFHFHRVGKHGKTIEGSA